MRFRIDQDSFIDNRIVPAGSEIEVKPLGEKDGKPIHHKPGPHWFPLDDEARDLVEQHKVRYTGLVPDPTSELSLQLADAEARAAASGLDHEKLGAVIAGAVAQGVAQALDARSGRSK